VNFFVTKRMQHYKIACFILAASASPNQMMGFPTALFGYLPTTYQTQTIKREGVPTRARLCLVVGREARTATLLLRCLLTLNLRVAVSRHVNSVVSPLLLFSVGLFLHIVVECSLS
jgi:hypothetical protein